MRRLLFGVVILCWMSAPAFAQMQHGDLAIGYAYMHETGISLPVGFAISSGHQMRQNVDLVVEGQYEHGNVDLIGTNVGVSIFAVQAGPRFSGGSGGSNKMRAFGQILAGVARATGSVGDISASTTAFAIQPGLGIDIPWKNAMAIRPQFDVLLTHTDGSWGHDTRVGVNVVWRR